MAPKSKLRPKLTSTPEVGTRRHWAHRMGRGALMGAALNGGLAATTTPLTHLVTGHYGLGPKMSWSQLGKTSLTPMGIGAAQGGMAGAAVGLAMGRQSRRGHRRRRARKKRRRGSRK